MKTTMPYRQKTNLTRGRTVAAILVMVASLANTRSEAASFSAIEGGRPPLATLEDGLRNVEIMDVAWKSNSLHPL